MIDEPKLPYTPPEVTFNGTVGCPIDSAAEPSRGDAYTDQQILGRDATLTPLLLPDVSIRVDDLLA